MSHSAEFRHGFNPLESLRRFVQRHDSLLRASQLAESIGSGINNNRYLSAIIFTLGSLAIYSTYAAINATRDFNALLEAGQKREVPIVPPTTSQLLEQRMGQLLNGRLGVVPALAHGQIQVEDDAGINVRDFSSVEHGARLRTGMDVPYYRVEARTGRPVEGIITNYVREFDKYDPRQLNRIWAVRWVKDGSTDNVLGRPEFITVYDRNDGGCLVSFTNPDAKVC